MKTLLGNRLINAIAIAIVTVFVIVLLSIWQNQRIQDMGDGIRHTNAVLSQSQAVQRTAMEFQLDVKNFLLTGDGSFLDTAGHTAALLPQKIDSLRNLIAGDSGQRPLLDSLQYYVSRSRVVLERAMRMSRTGDFENVSALIGDEARNGYSHRIQAMIDQLDTGQGRLLEARRTANRRRVTALQVALWATIAGVMVLALFILRKIRADRQKDMRAREQLRRFNQQLERKVEVQGTNLRSSETKYKTLFDKSPLPKWIYDNHTMRFLEVNDTAIRDYGYSRDEFLSMTIADIRPPEDVAALMDDVDNIRGRPDAFRNSQWRHIKKNGEIIDVDVTAHAIEFDGRKARMVVVKDITDRRKYELQLQRLNLDLAKRAADLATSNGELERFAYIASHDLQEPLRMVTSFLQLLQKKYNGQLDSKADQYIHYAVDGAERMKALIMDLLEYSRVGTGQESFGPVDTAVVMQEVGDIFREKIISARADVDIGPLPVVFGDKVQVTQLFQNLLSNALKYHSDKPPMIRIRAKEQLASWLFSVEDNGIGIDSQFFDKIFIIFQRLHNKNDYSGTGIGLAICKKIVERHGGKIWVESAPREGSTFYFTIHKKGTT